MVNGRSHRASIFLLSRCQYVSAMADDATGRDSDKFMLRLPDGMRDRLKAAAEANKRSMNAEIIARIESTLEAQSLDDQAAIELRDELVQEFSLAIRIVNSLKRYVDEGNVLTDTYLAGTIKALHDGQTAVEQVLGNR